MKFHEDICNGYLVMMRTSFFIYNNQKGITTSLKISPPKKRFNCGLTLKLRNMYHVLVLQSTDFGSIFTIY